MKIRYYHKESPIHELSIGYKALITLFSYITILITPLIGLLGIFFLLNILLFLTKYSLPTYYSTRYKFYISSIIIITFTVILQGHIGPVMIILFRVFLVLMVYNIYVISTNVLTTIYLIKKTVGKFEKLSTSKIFNFWIVFLITKTSFNHFYIIQKEKMMNNGVEFKFYKVKNHWNLLKIVVNKAEDILIEIEEVLAIRDFNLTKDEVFDSMIFFNKKDLKFTLVILSALLIFSVGGITNEILDQSLL